MVSEGKKEESLNIDMFEQRIYPLDRLISEKRMPILFVGSGVSGRYLSLNTWGSLLEKVASMLGIDRFQLNGIISKIELEHPNSNVNPLLASELSNMMLNGISNGSITRDDFPDVPDTEWNLMETQNPFKVVICNILKKGNVTDDSRKLKEIESFKKLSDKVPAVITTNDDFLETEIFKNFSTLIYPDDYYFSGSEGYGEILKVHGTIDDPESIIVTAEDYVKLKEESKVIMSRLTSLMCYHPVIFIGYSINDEEINSLIFDMVSSLKQTDIDKIRGHLIRVSVSDKLKKSKWNPKIEDHNGKRIETMHLEVPTLEVVFRYLDRFTPVATPFEIKKYKGMIREIVLSTDQTSKRISVIGEDSIDSIGSKNFAVIFGDAGSINSMMKGITGYDISDVIIDVMTKHKGLLDSSKAAFIKWISEGRVCNGDKYVPVFYYYLKFNIDYRMLAPAIVTFTDNMIDRLNSKIEEISKKCPYNISVNDIDDFLNSQRKSFPRCEALMYFQHAGIIDREECRKKLLTLYNEEEKIIGPRTKIKPDMRSAISYLDLQECLEKLCAEPRTLSH